MNYDQEITKLVEAVKADKSIIQPWRNKAVARLEEAQAFVRMGKTSTNGVGGAFNGQPAVTFMPNPTNEHGVTGCSCPSGTRNINCPIHGGL